MIKKTLNFLFNLPKTIFFNFHYLPFSQAIFLPIWLNRVKLLKMNGKLIIDNPNIRPGMVRLGIKSNFLYDTNRSWLIWEHRGVCCIKGSCNIGHNSAISTGKNGYLEFGENFSAPTTIKIACWKSIVFGENVRVAWEVIILDTDFHETVNIETGERSIPSKEIRIGKNNWVGIRTLVLKGAVTPNFCVIGANSILNKKYDFPEYSIIAGNPIKLFKTGYYHDLYSNVE